MTLGEVEPRRGIIQSENCMIDGFDKLERIRILKHLAVQSFNHSIFTIHTLGVLGTSKYFRYLILAG